MGERGEFDESELFMESDDDCSDAVGMDFDVQHS